MRSAILGSPVAHSLSPVLHTAAYRALGLTDWHYGRHEVDEAGLPPFLAGLGGDWAGLSLTMPLKRVALALAEQRSDLAAAVGAANTLTRCDGGWRADNTDVHGISAALREAGSHGPGQALILGAGGTAAAALAALCELGEANPTVLVRDVNRAVELRAAAERLGVTLTVRGGLHDGPLPAADVIISTLPAGAADGLRITGPATVLDVVYAPWPTSFARAAQQEGATIVSGLLMLLHQAAAQVELMTGRAAPLDAMRAALDGLGRPVT